MTVKNKNFSLTRRGEGKGSWYSKKSQSPGNVGESRSVSNGVCDRFRLEGRKVKDETTVKKSLWMGLTRSVVVDKGIHEIKRRHVNSEGR